MSISAILFDLDNTLYPASCGLMQGVDTRITEYVQHLLGVDQEEAAAIRRRYFLDYGTTLCGLQRHHGVDPEDYLAYVHDLALESFLASDAELDRLLGEVRATKAVFTNAPSEYARRVLTVLGVERHFAHIFDIRFFAFQPKPDPAGYRRALEALGIYGAQTLLIEDTPKNLVPARALGMTTILVSDGAGNGAAALADHVVPDILAALRIALDLERASSDRPRQATQRP